MKHMYAWVRSSPLWVAVWLAGQWVHGHAQAPAAPGLEKWSLCYERAEIPPWRRTDDTGLNFDLIRMAARQAHIAVEFVNLPWKRCLAQLQDNQMDGVFAASFHPERLSIGAYPGGNTPQVSMRLHVDRYVLVRRKGEAVTWDGKHITRLTGAVGTQLGYSIGKQLREQGIPVDDASQTAPELLKKLLAGRLGAAALGGSDASSLLAEGSAWAQQLEVLPTALDEKPYYLLLSHKLLKEQPRKAEQLWASIAAVRQSAEYRKLERAALVALQP